MATLRQFVPVLPAVLLALAASGCQSTRGNSQVTAGYTPATPDVPAALAPVTVPASPAAAVSALVPGASDTHVYVVDGADPLGLAGVAILAERIRLGGYPNTRYGGMFRMGRFEREIRTIHQQNPSAHFVLIGFSAGTYVVRDAANRLVRDGVPVAVVGYVGGDYLTDTTTSRPAGAQVVNVRGDGYMLTGRNLFFNGTELTGATNSRLDARHYQLPRRDETANALLGAMNAAGGVYSAPAAPTVVASPPPAKPTAPAVPVTSPVGTGN